MTTDLIDVAGLPAATNRTLSAPEPDTYRTAMGLLPTGVTVVTSGSGEDTEALTVSSVTSVSLVPLLLLISIGADGRLRRRVEQNRAFTVNVLGTGQEELSGRFASHGRPHGTAAQELLGPRTGRTGNALVEGAALSVDCEVEHEYPGGDHVLFIGRVAALHMPDEPPAPLVYHRGRYAALDRKGAAA
ncbi:flavin reductase [Streptomyces sp. CS149]|uniref:flavin reductase family protein n=1 Tax=Streptomyces TaxID=1883 RepID=UPI000D1A753C|nr:MULTISPECIES: flavin reductase family protein [unclassified Streptomyces]MCC8476999.1 flavin reductase family protein [Streptomyces globisporus]NUV71817.1 flavin reductase [Streptomyces sp. CAI-121]NUW03761.1 flavin reductase [Streptomyces sp. CAI 127]NUW17988.1 flavin reductase [Streptomyces sp. CAI-68]PSK71827.1 flavin reductase [Streptomyces sp. CS149]